VIANDISEIAIKKLQDRLGAQSEKVQWIVDDLTNSSILIDLPPVDLWHDRAVLHFFTKESDKNQYFALLHKLTKPGSLVILAAFSLSGADMCSGLSVHRYNAQMLAQRLGPRFELIEAFDYSYIQPSGNVREYVYTLFKKKE